MRRFGSGIVMMALLLGVETRAEFPPCVELPRIVPYSWEVMATPSEEFETLLKEYSAVQKRFSQLFVNARSEANNEDAAVSFGRRLQSLARRMVNVARENPADPIAVDALVWVAAHVPSAVSAEEVGRIAAVHHSQHEKLQSLYQHLAQADNSAAEQVAKLTANR